MLLGTSDTRGRPPLRASALLFRAASGQQREFATSINFAEEPGCSGEACYVPLSAAGRKPGRCRDTDFVCDPAADTYRCPGKQTLRFISQCDITHRRVYEAPKAACAICSLRAHCTTSQRGRRIGRSLDETYLERVRGYHQTEPFAKAMRKRKVWVEPLFAEAKEWHGLRRFRLRGLNKVNEAALVIAAGQNLKRLLRPGNRDSRAYPPP